MRTDSRVDGRQKEFNLVGHNSHIHHHHHPPLTTSSKSSIPGLSLSYLYNNNLTRSFKHRLITSNIRRRIPFGFLQLLVNPHHFSGVSSYCLQISIVKSHPQLQPHAYATSTAKSHVDIYYFLQHLLVVEVIVLPSSSSVAQTPAQL